MARFANKVSKEAKTRRSLIKVNPYELPEKALSLIANICNLENKDDDSVITGLLFDELYKRDSNGENFFDFINNNRSSFYNMDFYRDFDDLLDDLNTECAAHENTGHTLIAVAGGFSAGKSSFLNRITGTEGLLPTGIEPVSMVATYLYCSGKASEITVKGVNLKDAVVLLDRDVLQCIQHASSSKVYLASVLDKLFIDIPSTKLDGFAFIDTPGYNNSDEVNTTNGKTDETTALEAIDCADTLIWVVDAGAGTVTSRDKAVIEKFLNEDDNRKVAIIYNKADKKGVREMPGIIAQTAREFAGYGDRIIDVMGYSSHEDKVYGSRNFYDIPKLLDKIRLADKGNSGVERILNDIRDMFDSEIEYKKLTLEDYESQKKEASTKKNDQHKFLIDEKDGTKSYVESISSIMVDSYGEILTAADSLYGVSVEIINRWIDAVNTINENNEDLAWSSDGVRREISSCSYAIKKFTERVNNLFEYKYYTDEARQAWVERIKNQLDRIDSVTEERLNEIEELENNYKTSIKDTRRQIATLERYRDITMQALRNGIATFSKSAHKPQDARLAKGQRADVFSSIRSGRYSDFLNCFTEGVNLTEFNPEGYSPLTYAVRCGATDMLRFFIRHEADLAALDGRGMNAYHTAVDNGHRDQIELIVKEMPAINDSKTADGRTAADLAAAYDFGKWFTQNVN